MKRAALWLLASGTLVAVVGGCGPHRYFVWQPRPVSPAVAGKMAITVADHREEKRGGKDPRVIGLEPQNNGFTGLIPLPLKLKDPTVVASTMQELLAEAALSQGIGIAPLNDPAPTSKLTVEVQTWWCTGFPPVMKVNIAASAILLGPDGQVRVPGLPLQAEGTWANCKVAYEKALNGLLTNAQGIFSQDGFKNAATGAGPAAPIAAPAPANG